MEIFVAIKQVPDTDKVKMDPVTGTMVREGVDTIVNPLDLYAIELAIRLKEKHGGRVTAFTMGPPAADKALKEAMAMGCDSGVLITDRAFSGSDTWATSYALSRAIARMSAEMGRYDLILAGERATDGDTGQVGPCLAAWLDIPVLSYVGSIESSDERGIVAPRIIARRLVEEGYQRVRVDLPCLLTVVKEVANPRLPTLRGKKFARQSKITVYTAADLDATPEYLGLKGSPTKVSRIFYPKVTRGGETVKAADEAGVDLAVERLVDFLADRDLVSASAAVGGR
ncbi:MAG: electron transfer flavoprotein subunit beta/FixA family protein [Rectinemataceae bacterium]|nr:electron transfer flavoprotein subunit beta/FixA family protein [Rectinemataceae bacterium]